MATEGFEGLYVETRNYGATAAFWKSLGFQNAFETGHGSGQWEHPSGGPFVFISEHPDGELRMRPILHVSDSTTFSPERVPDYVEVFTPQHWNVVEAVIRDPDGREIALQAPLPPGVTAPDSDMHHEEKYGSH